MLRMLFSGRMNPPVTKRFSGKALQITHRKALKWFLSTYIRIVNPILAKKSMEKRVKRKQKGAPVRKPLYNILSDGYVLQR